MNGAMREAAIYPYADATGAPSYETIRYENPKTFRQRRVDGHGGHSWGLKDVARLPYRLPEVIDGIKVGRTIVIVEGEKDVDALRALAIVATTNAGGAGWPWTADFAAHFRGAKRIVVIADSDKPGRKAAHDRAELLATVCHDVRILDLAPDRDDGYDVSDYLAEHEKPQLLELMRFARRIEILTDSAPKKPGLQLTNLDTVEPEAVKWLWDKRIPVGKLTLLCGDPGGGKSFLSLAIAAAITRGQRLPDDAGEVVPPARVLMVNFEDGLSDTIRPRAELVGCDLSRTTIIEGVKEDDRLNSFAAHHVPMLETALEEMPDVKILFIDPISNLLSDINTSRDNEVRTALMPLKLLAERRGLSIICVMHLRKAEAERTLYRISGSIAFAGFARCALLVAKDDESGRRSVSRIKGNLSADPTPVEFTIDENGFSWQGIAPELSADVMLDAGKKRRSEAVTDFVKAELADGPRRASDVYSAGEEHGFTKDQLKNAKKKLGVDVRKEQGVEYGSWMWVMPGKNDTPLRSCSLDQERIPPCKESIKPAVTDQGSQGGKGVLSDQYRPLGELRL